MGLKLSDLTTDDLASIFGSLNLLSGLAHANSEAHGFWDEYERTLNVLHLDQDLQDKYTLEIKLSKLALMMSELGEAVEGIRKPGPDQHLPQFSQEAVELADVLIRVFDYCGKFGVPLAEALLEKMKYNAGRPYKHGKGA